MTGQAAVCTERDVRARIIALHVPMPLSVSNGKPRNREGSRTYIGSEPSLVKLVGKRTSTNAATGSGSKVNQNPTHGETNHVGDSGWLWEARSK